MTDRPASAPLVAAVAPCVSVASTDPERARIAEGDRGPARTVVGFGPYLSERAWGTVREEYSGSSPTAGSASTADGAAMTDASLDTLA